MAVDISTNPFVILAADVSSNKIWPTTLKIEHIEWVGYTSDADTALVKNGAGKTVWAGNGAADLSPILSYDIGFCHGGLIVDSIDSGELHIYIC